MDSIKGMARDANAIFCGEGGIMMGSCKKSLQGNSNYAGIILGTVFVQYVFPMMVVMILIPIIIGNVIAISLVEFLMLFNPFFVALYIPVTIIDAVFVGIFIVGTVSTFLVYWGLCFSKIGIFSVIPFLNWLAAIFVWFIPVIGPIAAIIMSIFPAMMIGIFVHKLVYKGINGRDLPGER
jgi:hypothetical protein